MNTDKAQPTITITTTTGQYTGIFQNDFLFFHDISISITTSDYLEIIAPCKTTSKRCPIVLCTGQHSPFTKYGIISVCLKTRYNTKPLSYHTALTWLKHNIHYFGGNPNNITIFPIADSTTPLSPDTFTLNFIISRLPDVPYKRM